MEILEVEKAYPMLRFSDFWRWISKVEGELAQLARAPALHAGGHRFDSDILHDKYFFKVFSKLKFEEGPPEADTPKASILTTFIDILK